MNIYEYIARSNPQGARMVIQLFGYRITDNKRMGDNLRMLVAQEGEPALRELAKLHPDKDLILEVFNEPKEGKLCSCNDKKENFLGADATLSGAVLANNQQQNQASDSTKLAMQTNTMLFLATSLIVVALIVNKK
jgi:hypothetical protein